MKEQVVINGLKITPAMFEVFEQWFTMCNMPSDSVPATFVDVLIDVQDILSDIVGEDIDNKRGNNREYLDLITKMSSLRRDLKKITPDYTYYE